MPVRNLKSRLSQSVSFSAPADWLSLLPRHPHAFVVGAGPNGLSFHGHEPDGLKIACNSAITIPWPWDIWIVFDLSAPEYPWFHNDTPAKRVFGRDLAKHYKHDVSFEYMPTMHVVTEPNWGVLHGGATVAGCAIQLAYWLGCERITLLGIDQYGDKHFDGTVGAPKHFGRKWSTVKLLEKTIGLVTARGMKVDTLSRTELAVPLVKLW
jgi:hypothetical protein